MVIALVKKPKPVAVAPAPEALDTTLSEFAALIDEYGDVMADAAKIDKKIKELQAQLKPVKELEKKLQEKLDALAAGDDATGEEKGTRWRIEYGKRGSSTKIANLPKIAHTLGAKLFYQLAKINITDLRAYLTPPQLEEVTTVERTSRSFKVFKAL